MRIKIFHRGIKLFLPVILLLGGIPVKINSQIIPTSDWSDYAGTVVNCDGSETSIGTQIKAYDPDGILCGIFEINNQGFYGYLHVYGDDPFTDIDEGAEVGDTITFYINNHLAETENVNVWEGNRIIFENNNLIELNEPPYFSTVFENATEDVNYSVTLTVDDFENDSLYFSVIEIPSWLSFDGNNLLSGTPTNDDVIDSVEISVAAFDDHCGTDTLTQFISVINVNDPPYFTVMMPDTITFRADQQDTLYIDGLAGDIDNDPDSLIWSNTIGSFVNCFIDSAINAFIFSSIDTIGNETILLSVSDGFADTSHSLIVNIEKSVGFIENSTDLPGEYSLSQNYPNPFNPATKIRYNIPVAVLSPVEALQVVLTVYDILGAEITTLVNAKQRPGSYEVEFNTENLPSGIYFYRITTEKYSETKKMMLIK